MAKRTVMRVPALAIIAAAAPGDRVSYLQYAGRGRYGLEYRPASGRVVMARPGGAAHLVLNIGGRHGTPAVVSEVNVLSLFPKGHNEQWDAPVIVACGVK